MKPSLQKIVTFDEFVEFLQAQKDNIRYELYDGDIIQMPLPTGEHEEIIAFLGKVILVECNRLKLNYGIPKTVLVKAVNEKSGYFPDVPLLNLTNLVNEPLWKKESTVSNPDSIGLLIEVVSTNWRDDYHKKFADYVGRSPSRRVEMGIKEYWIVDYAALGSKLLIGDPKQPTITIYSLNSEGEYQGKQFRGDDRIESPTFPELNLTAQQIFQTNNN